MDRELTYPVVFSGKIVEMTKSQIQSAEHRIMSDRERILDLEKRVKMLERLIHAR